MYQKAWHGLLKKSLGIVHNIIGNLYNTGLTCFRGTTSQLLYSYLKWHCCIAVFSSFIKLTCWNLHFLIQMCINILLNRNSPIIVFEQSKQIIKLIDSSLSGCPEIQMVSSSRIVFNTVERPLSERTKPKLILILCDLSVE